MVSYNLKINLFILIGRLKLVAGFNISVIHTGITSKEAWWRIL